MARELPETIMTSMVHLLHEAARQIEEETAKELDMLGLTPRLLRVMIVLVDIGPSSQRAMGELLDIDRTTMVAIVDQLESLGLVERQRDPDDRRAWRVVPTSRGESTCEWAVKMVSSAEERALAALTPNQRETLRALLLKLARASSSS